MKLLMFYPIIRSIPFGCCWGGGAVRTENKFKAPAVGRIRKSETFEVLRVLKEIW